MAQRSVRWQLRERGPDAAQRLLSPPDAGADGHHRPGRFPPGPQPDLLQAAGAQRGDPRHDPPRPGVPGCHNLPPRLQRLRDQPLTGAQEPPTPSIPTLTSPVATTIDPPKTISTSLAAGRRGPAPAHLAAASSCVSAAAAARLQTDTCLSTFSTPEPYLDQNLPLLSPSSCTVDSDTSLLDFPKPPDLFSSHSCTNTPDFTLPRTREQRRRYLDENVYQPFRGHSSHSSPLLHLHSSKHLKSSLTSNMLPTVASEPTLLAQSDSNAPPVPPRGSHLPHFPRSPYKYSNPSQVPQPSHDTVLTQGPAPSSSLLHPPPPPPCPTGPGEAAAWGCCCSLGGAATPLTRYLGKVGHAALPLLKAGGLLNAEPSDVQTWDVNVQYQRTYESKCLKPTTPVQIMNLTRRRRRTCRFFTLSQTILRCRCYRLLPTDTDDLMWFYASASFRFTATCCKIDVLLA